MSELGALWAGEGAKWEGGEVLRWGSVVVCVSNLAGIVAKSLGQKPSKGRMIENKMTKACVAGWRAGFGAVRKMH